MEFALFDDSAQMTQPIEHHTVETDEEETREENRESGLHDRPIKITTWHHEKKHQEALEDEWQQVMTEPTREFGMQAGKDTAATDSGRAQNLF